MRSIWKKLPYNIKLPLIYFGISLTILFIYRLAFFAVYSYRLGESPAWEVLLAFLVGFRFDIVICSMMLGAFFLLAGLHYPNRLGIYRLLWIYGPLPLMLYMIIILGVDIVYYENANKHIGYEAFAFLGKDLLVIGAAALEQNPASLIGGLLLAFLILLGIHLVLRKFPYVHVERSPLIFGLQLFMIILLVWLGIRGGPQNSPLRSSNAIISKNTFINNVAINGAYTAVTDLKITGIPPAHKMNIKEAIHYVRKETAYPGAEFISQEYPLLRKQSQTRAGRPPNIVFIMLENWTGKFVAPIGSGLVDGKEVAPHFNRMLKDGLFFKRYFATGGRTTNGMLALLTGIPDRPGLTVARTQQVLGKFAGLGNILKPLGYQSIFVTGGDLSFDNKHTLMPHWGFDTVLGKKHMDKSRRYKIGAWGYDDGDILDVLHRQILSADPKKPFIAVSLTLTTHYPYRTPHKKFRIFDESTRDHQYLNVYHYADWAVHDFMEKARKSPYFKNTIFVFSADHSHHRYLTYYEDRNVPLLLYAPGVVKPGLRNDISSQLDVIPTILGLIGKEVYFSAMGRNLLARKARSAYFAYGNLFGWIEDEKFYFQTVEGGGAGETAQMKPPFDKTGLCRKDRKNCWGFYNKTRAFLNLSYHLMSKNKIFPSDRELKKIKGEQELK